MGRIIWMLGLMALFLGSGCVNTPRGQAAGGDVAVEAVHGRALCTGASISPTAVWIDSRQMLIAHWQRMLSHRIGEGKPSIPQIEWDTHGLVLIHMGQKSTGGYGLELLRRRALLKGGTAYVRINWKQPPAKAIVTMMITSPCLLVKIQRGDYNSVAIIDQSGRQRAQADF